MKKLLLAAALCAVATPAFALFDMDAPGIVQTLPTTVTASTTALTGAFSASLPAVPLKTNSLCGFVITSGGTTTAVVVNVTVTGTVSGTLNYAYVFPSSGQGVLGVALPSCIAASSFNTAITVSVPAGGAGTTAALTVWEPAVRRWLALAILVASAVCAHAQLLDGVTTSTTAGGSPVPPSGYALLLENGAGNLLLEGGSSNLCLEGSSSC